MKVTKYTRIISGFFITTYSILEQCIQMALMSIFLYILFWSIDILQIVDQYQKLNIVLNLRRRGKHEIFKKYFIEMGSHVNYLTKYNTVPGGTS